MNAKRLLALYSNVAEAPDAVPRLRRFVLDLAVRGKLVAQDAGDEPALAHLMRIEAETEATLDIPAPWACVPLGRVLDFKYGKGMKASERLDDGPVPVFGSNGILGYTTAPLTEEPAIIVGRKGSAGAFNLCDGPSWTTDVAYYVEVPRFFSLRYLFLTLQSLKLDTLAKGVKPGLSRADAYPLLLGVPPRAEQRRIVAKVEELMALLDRLEAARTAREATRDRLTAASLTRLTAPDTDAETFPTHVSFALATLPALTARPDQIKPLRQTILNLAVRGKLVEQDPANEPLPHIDKGIPSDAEAPFAIPTGWQWSRLRSLGTLKGGGTPSKVRGDFWNGNIPWVSPKDMKVDYIDAAQLSITDVAVVGSAVNLIEPESVLFVVRGMILAHSFPVAISKAQLTINQDMKAITLKKPEMAEYILRALKGLTPTSARTTVIRPRIP